MCTLLKLEEEIEDFAAVLACFLKIIGSVNNFFLALRCVVQFCIFAVFVASVLSKRNFLAQDVGQEKCKLCSDVGKFARVRLMARIC